MSKTKTTPLGCTPFAAVKGGKEVVAWGFVCSMPLRFQHPSERLKCIPKGSAKIPQPSSDT